MLLWRPVASGGGAALRRGRLAGLGSQSPGGGLLATSLMCLAYQTPTLKSTPLAYRGVLVDVTEEDVPSFKSLLPSSLQKWSDDGCNSCMLRLPIEHAALATYAAECGFEFHHAEGRYAVLKRWLQPHKEDKVPPYATHRTRARMNARTTITASFHASHATAVLTFPTLLPQKIIYVLHSPQPFVKRRGRHRRPRCQ